VSVALRFEAPTSGARPSSFAPPAADGTPHPWAVLAAQALMRRLEDPAAVADHDLAAPGAGKMFGVLVVQDDAHQLAVLHGFSGMLARRWVVPGFVPPLFDAALLDAFWPAGEAELDAMTAEIETLRGRGPAGHDARRRLEAERRARSQALWGRIQGTYRIPDRAGNLRTLAELFAPGVPPGGAGDCVAPKLVGAAHRLGLRPLALAELWWGASVGTRTHGSFHAPCARKCGPVLAHLLAGL
jgi:tRNA pseudouridine32 synthase / 23S rRNA pseudouridine746 synthase